MYPLLYMLYAKQRKWLYTVATKEESSNTHDGVDMDATGPVILEAVQKMTNMVERLLSQ